MNQEIKQLCLERDAHRCRHCGNMDNLDAIPLMARTGHAKYHLSNLVTLCYECATIANKVRTQGDNDRVGVVLCGGRGTRLYPLTMHQNKHTLPVGLVPMVFYPIKTLQAFGVKRAVIVTDREGSNETAKILGSGREFGMDFSYKIQEGAGGIAEALYLAKDMVKPMDEIVVVLGDNIFDLNTLDTNVSLRYPKWEVERGLADKDAFVYKSCVYLKKVSNPEAYGVAIQEEYDSKTKAVMKIVEKPQEFVSNMAVVGLYIYTSDVFNVIENIEPSDRGELEISAVNNYYASQAQLTSREVIGYWGDAGGSIRRYAECSMYGAKQANVSGEEIDGFRSVVFDDR